MKKEKEIRIEQKEKRKKTSPGEVFRHAHSCILMGSSSQSFPKNGVEGISSKGEGNKGRRGGVTYLAGFIALFFLLAGPFFPAFCLPAVCFPSSSLSLWLFFVALVVSPADVACLQLPCVVELTVVVVVVTGVVVVVMINIDGYQSSVVHSFWEWYLVN